MRGLEMSGTARDRKKLELQRRQLVHECVTTLRKASALDPEIKQLLQLNAELDTESCKDGRLYHLKLARLRALVEQFKSRVADIINRRSTDASGVQEILKRIEELIKEYRNEETTAIESLLREETDLWQACLLSEKRINFWSEEDDAKIVQNNKTSSRTMRQSTSASWLDVTSDLTPEVGEYEHFLESHGGRFGGWTDAEHSVFLRFFHRPITATLQKSNTVLTKDETKAAPSSDWVDSGYRQESGVMTNRSLCSEATSEQPDQPPLTALHRKISMLVGTRTPEEVRAHEVWWIHLRRLEEAKRRAIQQWRESKRSTTADHTGLSSTDAQQPSNVPQLTKPETKKAILGRLSQQCKPLVKREKQDDVVEESKHVEKQEQQIKMRQVRSGGDLQRTTQLTNSWRRPIDAP